MDGNFDPNTITVIVGAFVAIITGFYAITKIMLNQASKDRTADREERKEFVRAIRDMSKSSKMVASATIRSADEAKERNGHLAELVAQGTTVTQSVKDSLEEHSIGNQTVEHQTIGQQVVKEQAK